MSDSIYCASRKEGKIKFQQKFIKEEDLIKYEYCQKEVNLIPQALTILSFPLGGKLIFMDLGPIELRVHSILVSDGGELRIGSEDKPFQGRAEIKLYGSSHSTPFFPYGVKFLAVRNGTLSLHGE